MNAALRVTSRIIAAPPWGRAVALVFASGLSAWALVDAFQPPSGSAAQLGPAIQHFDKVLHAISYGALALAACQALAGITRNSPAVPTPAAHAIDADCPRHRPVIASVWLYATVIGVLAELCQWLADQGRDAEIADAVAGSVGALAACLLFGWARAVQCDVAPKGANQASHSKQP